MLLNRNKAGYVLCHLNVRSLYKSLDELRYLIGHCEGLNRLFLSFSETWLSSEIPDGAISLPGYKLYRKDRDGHGGGVVVYYPDGVKAKRREDLECTEIEGIWMEVVTSKKKRLLLFAVQKQCDFIIEESESCLF